MRVHVGAYVIPAPRRLDPCGLGLRPFTATLALTRHPPARWPGSWLLKIVPFAIAAATAPRLKPPALVRRAMLVYK